MHKPEYRRCLRLKLPQGAVGFNLCEKRRSHWQINIADVAFFVCQITSDVCRADIDGGFAAKG